MIRERNEKRKERKTQGREGGHRKAHTDTRDGHTVDDGGPLCVEMHGMREMHDGGLVCVEMMHRMREMRAGKGA